MSVGAVYDSRNYSFGSLADIRKQADAIKKRAGAEREARMAEQDKTGLIRNPDTGEMVQLSSISEETRERWNDREELNTISPYEAMILFKDADPNAEEVEENKKLAAKATKLQDKMLSGQTLTGKEKSFLREHFPQLADMADRMEQEAEQLEKSLQGCKTKDEAHKAYVDAKARLVSGANKKDGSILFLSAALDEAYARHTGRGGAAKRIDTWA